MNEFGWCLFVSFAFLIGLLVGRSRPPEIRVIQPEPAPQSEPPPRRVAVKRRFHHAPQWVIRRPVEARTHPNVIPVDFRRKAKDPDKSPNGAA
jgi:hypothetical protein